MTEPSRKEWLDGLSHGDYVACRCDGFGAKYLAGTVVSVSPKRTVIKVNWGRHTEDYNKHGLRRGGHRITRIIPLTIEIAETINHDKRLNKIQSFFNTREKVDKMTRQDVEAIYNVLFQRGLV